MGSTFHSAAEAATSLHGSLSKTSHVLVDPDDVAFKESMKRWTDVGFQTPAAILKPTNEEDIIKIVDYATKNNIPFVAKAGGHSPWSTIGSQGWIIDNELLTGITLDTENHTATIQAGVQTKLLNETVGKTGFCIQSAGASTVGYIPFLLGGGSTWMTGMYGLAVDNLISARIVTAKNGLVIASETENVDLFWALKGAGQFFGIVTEVTAKIFPLEQKITTWTCIFLPSQMKDVAATLELFVNGNDIARSPGMAAIMALPGQTTPVVMVNTMHFRPEAEADKVVAPLLALKPIKQVKNTIDFANITDAAEALNKQGGLKTQISCGMKTFSAKKFEAGLESFTKLVEEYPSASGSLFMYNWYSTEAMMKRPESSAYSHRDVGTWSMSFVSYAQEDATPVLQNAEAFLAMCQEDQSEDEKSLFPNHTRVHSLEQRYRGEERRNRLRELKSIWDPEGVFTRQFL